VAEKITVTILTKNSATYLWRCLDALRMFDEVIVLDTGSSDETLSIAQPFSNVKVSEYPFKGFGPMKNLAVEKASNDWILSIDSDEIVTPSLAEEIFALELDCKKIYSVERDNFYRDRLIRGCGWNNDRVLRLFNRIRVRFNDRLIHEGLSVADGTQIVPLAGRLQHFPYDDVAQLLQKMQHYSTLWAEENCGKKKSTPVRAFLNGMITFFKSYLLQNGWRYGYEGLLISVSNANGAFYKYIKLYEYGKTGKL